MEIIFMNFKNKLEEYVNIINNEIEKNIIKTG